MPIVVDTTRAPQFLVYQFNGPLPSTKEQSSLHGGLISMGVLTADTIALMDARGLVVVPGDELPATMFTALHHDDWPRRRAYLFNSDMHLHMIQSIRELAMTTVTAAAFADEEEALKWLRAG